MVDPSPGSATVDGELNQVNKPRFKRGVSLYCYQELFYRGLMSLEDCVAAAAATGADGAEMVLDQMVPGYPSIRYNLSPEFRAHWLALMDKYRMKPIALDVYGETRLYRHRTRSDDELITEMTELLRTAKDLNMDLVRMSFHLPPTVIEAMVPRAEDMDIRFGVEVHAPHHLDGAWVQSNIELIERTGTRHFGLIPDLGTFSRTIPRLVLDQAQRQGAQPHVIQFLEQVYAAGGERPQDLVAQVKAMGGNDADEWLAIRVLISVWTWHEPRLLERLAKYIIHVHAKFYEMTPEGREPDIAYDEIMQSLIDAGYEGYLMSEYEGQRLIHGVDKGYDEVEQVRRHQAMLQRWQNA